MPNPEKGHWQGVKWILRYLNGAKNFGLTYCPCTGIENVVTGYAFKVFGCTVSWKAAIQHVIVLFTTETEYIALSEAIREGYIDQGFG